MHPVARAFHYIFLVAGLLLLVVGYVEQNDQSNYRSLNQTWECYSTGTSTSPKQHCNTQSGSIYGGSKNNLGIAICLAGVGLLVASAAVAVGGRRSTATASGIPAPAAATGPGGYSAYPQQPAVQPFQGGQAQPGQTPPAPPSQAPGQPGNNYH